MDAPRLGAECQSIDNEKKSGIGGIVYYSIHRLYRSFSWLIIANIIIVSRRNSAESLMGTTAPEHFADLFLGELYEWETYMHAYRRKPRDVWSYRPHKFETRYAYTMRLNLYSYSMWTVSD